MPVERPGRLSGWRGHGIDVKVGRHSRRGIGRSGVEPAAALRVA
jgi:hypothetical protein